MKLSDFLDALDEEINLLEAKEKIFEFHIDAGHGWLKVHINDLKELNLTDKISVYSYYDHPYVYLEEDSDAVKFWNAYKKKYGKELKYKTIYDGDSSPIRNLPPYLKEEINEWVEGNYKEEIRKLKKDISQIKKKLIKKTKKTGLWENFGQKEIRLLKSKYFDLLLKSKEANFLMDNFIEWAENFDLSNLKEEILSEERGSLRNYPETADFLLNAFGNRDYYDKARDLIRNRKFKEIISLREKLAKFLKKNKKAPTSYYDLLTKINKSIEIILDLKGENNFNEQLDKFHQRIKEEVKKVIKK